ncbi:MAG: hypothetical protein RXP98_01995 [Thermoplasmata archaeon]
MNKSYAPSPSSGTFTVSGANVNVAIKFTLVTYTITFTESGLPSGTTWYVNLSNGQSYSGTGTTITFNEPNGTYSYTIATVNKSYAPSPSSGTFTINGVNVNVSITFNQVTYTITFTESGLPSGTTWSVTLGGITKTSNTTTIIFNMPNGTYNYSLSYPSGFVIKNGADKIIVYIEGKNVTLLVTFERSKSNNLFMWLIILGGLLAFITIIALILFRRRRKDKESNIDIEDVY